MTTNDTAKPTGLAKWLPIVGLVLHVLIAGLLLFAGFTLVFGGLPPEAVDELAKYGLKGQIRLIGCGELACAVLLLIPKTSPFGTLLTSGFWGGTICLHLTHGEPYIFQSALLVLTWVGAHLRGCVRLWR